MRGWGVLEGVEEVEASALEDLFRATYADLVRLATLVTADAAVAEDVVQDAFAGLHRRAEPLTDPARAVGYLRRSVVNGARDRLRRRRTERAPRVWVVTATSSTEEQAEADDDARAVAAAVARLPLRQREVVALHHQQGLTHTEVAAVLGVSVGSVKTHLHRAHRRLAEILEDRR